MNTVKIPVVEHRSVTWEKAFNWESYPFKMVGSCSLQAIEPCRGELEKTLGCVPWDRPTSFWTPLVVRSGRGVDHP